jgi:AraC-like DNA-binding protein
MYCYKKLSLIFFIITLGLFTHAQNPITFVITHTPTYTPENDTLFLVTSLDNWKEADSKKRFKLYPDGYYRLTIDIGNVKKFEYKINRGNWDKVEGNNWGDFLANRRFTYSDSIYEVKVRVESWQDLHDTQFPPVQIVVISVPGNTPHDASIFLAGTFNDWMDNDPAYKLTKSADGTYIGEIQAGLDSFSYKFTRGTWESIEGRWDGGMRSNRVYVADRANNEQIVAEIKSWHDLSTGMNWLKVIYLVFFLQSLMVLSLLTRYVRNSLLIFLSVLISLVFFVRFFYSDFSLFYKFPKAFFLPAMVYPFIGPYMYSWFKSSITKEEIRLSYIHFLPLVPTLWYIIKLSSIPTQNFYLNIVNNEYIGFFFLSYAYGLMLHLFYNYKLRQLIARQIAEIPDLTYRFYKGIQTNWFISVVFFIAALMSFWQHVEVKFITDWLENFLWIGIGIVVFYYQWFLLSNFYTNLIKNKSKPGKEPLGEDSWARLKGKLTELMIDKAVFTNPNLTLADLAGYLGTNNHYVSKLINEGFKKSYTDYINSYRVEAFIEAMKKDEHNNTFLYHAYKVGFNSKSAFNRAFKKVTGVTPSEYFAEIK